jgi:hypothetical protein
MRPFLRLRPSGAVLVAKDTLLLHGLVQWHGLDLLNADVVLKLVGRLVGGRQSLHDLRDGTCLPSAPGGVNFVMGLVFSSTRPTPT